MIATAEVAAELSASVELLIAEDDAFVAKDMRRSLEAIGYGVVDTVSRADRALEVARAKRPDLVLMDIRLEDESDGVEAGNAILEQLDIPVVFVTAHVDEETRARAQNAAPFGYLVKPFSEGDLQTAIEVALLRHRTERELSLRAEQQSCLYEVSRILHDVERSLEERLQAVVQRLPAGWQHPDLAEARLCLEDEEYRSHGFSETDRSIGSDVEVSGERIGRVEVHYRGERIAEVAEPFRKAERRLLDEVADRVAVELERNRLQHRIRERALHDDLTELANRSLFLDRLGHALDRTERTGERLAVFFLDLKRFKVVNDSLGHEAGDRVLVQVARRFQEGLRETDTVARIGGDEFTVLLEDVEREQDVEEVVDRLLHVFDEPFRVADEVIPLDGSIGVVVHGGDGDGDTEPSDLLRWADKAMYRAKQMPGTQCARADPPDMESSPPAVQKESRLRAAIRRGDIDTVYQPIFSVESRAIEGVEALARWRDPQLGRVTPDDFIPLAEKTGLIVPLGEAQLRSACSELVETGFVDGKQDRPLRLHVNLSARQLEDPEIAARTSRILEEVGFPPSRLCLELTESAAMRQPEAVQELREIGVRLAIDDFGTEYSTLTQLRHLTVDTLKLDQTFIAGLPENERDRAIVETILTLGRSLSIGIVAEGIESGRQLEFLRERGCDGAQGFYLATPQTSAELKSLVENGSDRP